MERLGIIDIGSNSVRLVLCDIKKCGSFKIIDDIKESIRLGEDIELNNILSEEKIATTLNTLNTFKTLCMALNADKIIVVATEALRKASNGEKLIDLAKSNLDMDIKVLEGSEEAKYDALAVMNSIYTKNSLIVDIGGASTELAWIYNGKVKECTSLPFGAVNLTKRYNLYDIIKPSDDNDLRNFLITQYKSIPWLFEANFDEIIGIGGSIRNIGKIDRKRKRYPLDIAHNYELTSYDVSEIYYLVKSKNLKQRMKIEGLSKDRADIFVAAVSSLNTLAELLNITNIRISGKGLREGLIFEYMKSKYDITDNILDSSLEGVLESHDMNKEHARNVYNISMKLFSDLKPLHKLDESFNNILKTAALLHDSGISIRYYDHHKHSFYIIINSQINGLSHKELVMSAYLAASHRNNDFQVNLCHFSGIINRMDVESITKVGVLLRIAESLDRSMIGALKALSCSINKDSVEIKIHANKDMSLEIKDALKTKNAFEEIYGKELIIDIEK